MKEFIYLKPDYYNDFKCIGKDCRHNCCNFDWRIDIDRKTYKKYQNVNKNDVSKEMIYNIEKFIKRNKSSVSDIDYASIQLLQDSKGVVICPFNSSEGLCTIQCELGIDYLSRTCLLYPRTYNYLFDNIIEHSLYCSCEALLNILYDKKEPIIFITENETLNDNEYYKKFGKIARSVNPEKNPIHNFYLNIKTTSIAILQNRNYNIEKRLSILMFFLKNIDTMDKNKEYLKIESYCQTFLNSIDDDIFNTFDELEIDYEFQFNISFFISKIYSANVDSNLYFFKDIEDSYGQLKLNALDNGNVKLSEDNLKKYKEYIHNYYNFMKDKEYFIEHILVSEFHSKTMPFYSTFSIFENAQCLAIYYSMLRCVLSAYMYNKETISQDELIDIIEIYSRRSLHSPDSFKKTINLVNSNECNNVINTCLLIKGI